MGKDAERLAEELQKYPCLYEKREIAETCLENSCAVLNSLFMGSYKPYTHPHPLTPSQIKIHTHPHPPHQAKKRSHSLTLTHNQPKKVTLTHTYPHPAKKSSHSPTHTHTQPKKGHTHPYPPTSR